MAFDDIVAQVASLAPGGLGPDIFVGAHDRLGELVPTGVAEPIDLGDKKASFRPVSVDAFTYGGQLYGLPYLTQGAALFYNRDLVAGGVAPATWSDLKLQAGTFQSGDATRQGYCLQSGDAYHTYPLLTGFGGYVFGRGADGSYVANDVGLDSAGGLASAVELDGMVKAGLVRPGVDYNTCLTLMTTGRAMFWITGPWALPDFNASAINFGVAPMPAMANAPRPFVGAQGLLVSHFGPNKDSAVAFLRDYVATYDVMLQLWEADPRLPTWNELADTMTDPNTAAFIASVDGGDPIPAIPEMAGAWGPWIGAINEIFAQRQDPETAFREAAAAIRGQ
jgi:maltose-binding protein MalE